MELSNPVLSGLVRKRQEITISLEAVQAQLRTLTGSLDATDATIRLIDPAIDLDVVHVRPARRHNMPHGETSRLILGLLREAGGPMTCRELTLGVTEARGVSAADPASVRTMRARVGNCAARMREAWSVGNCGRTRRPTLEALA